MALLLAAGGVAGCAGTTNNNGGNGNEKDMSVTACTGPKCGNTLGCNTTADCKSTPATPICDTDAKVCVTCLQDTDCLLGQLCFMGNHTCTAGCSVNHACAVDAGVCETDAGACVQCNSDADCLDPVNPRCDPTSRKCYPCNPTGDNCGYALYCAQAQGGSYSCSAGCKTDVDCQPQVIPSDMAESGDGGDGDGGTTQGGGSDGGTMPANPNAYCDPVKHSCVRCQTDNECPLGNVCKGDTCVAGCTDQHGCANALACCSAEGAMACTDTTSDFQNCGGCGVVCQGGWNCCNSGCSNPTNDLQNCGGCGVVCVAKNGTPGCTARACVLAACNMGYADCNGVYMDGCETHTDSNINNCGACNNACSIPHALSKCTGGACLIDSCLPGWGDCDGLVANGCETNILNDPLNCGGCNLACSGANISQPTCTNMACTGQCNVGFADCDGNKQTNGCEINVTNDVNNCGGCSTLCSQQCAGHVTATVCANSQCSVSTMNGCQVGYQDVDGTCSNGCECHYSQTGATTCAMLGAANVITIGTTFSKTATLMIDPNLPYEDWYSFDFTGSDQVKTFHAKVQLTTTATDPNAFTIEVYAGCDESAPLCGTVANPSTPNGESNKGIRSWDVSYTAAPTANGMATPPADQTSVTAGGASNLVVIPQNILPPTVYVRVVRSMNVPAKTCADNVYTITATNQN